MTIRVKKTIDLTIDLNTYYPSFPAGLRKQIDEEVIRLCSEGGKAKQVKVHKDSPSTYAPFSWKHAPEDTTIYLTGKTPTKGISRRFFLEAARKFNEEGCMLKDLKDLFKVTFHIDNPDEINSYLSVFRRGGYIILDMDKEAHDL